MHTTVNKMPVYAATGAALGWFTICAQLCLMLVHRVRPVPDTIIQFLSYFTILTNILVALAFTFQAVPSGSVLGKFFARGRVLTGIAVYITVVGLVYNTILRFLWNPQGLQRIVDELLHLLIPLLFIVYWLLFVSKKRLKWKHTLPWLVFPLVYLLYVILWGSISELYPYPFLDVNALGYSQVFLNSFFMALVFLICSLLFVGVAKMISARRPGHASGARHVSRSGRSVRH